MVFHRAERGNVAKWLDPRGRGVVGFLSVRQWPAASRGTSFVGFFFFGVESWLQSTESLTDLN